MFGHLAAAQIDTLKPNSDELFALAREKAFAGQREEARQLCKTILARSPSYSDARVLLGRTYAWDGRREEARAEFYKLLEEKPSHKDALDALLDVELWDNRLERALDIANRGLNFSPSDEDFLQTEHYPTRRWPVKICKRNSQEILRGRPEFCFAKG